MTPTADDDAPDGQTWVPIMEAGLVDAKRLVERCRDEDIPARLGSHKSCGSGGCAPKALVLVHEADVPRAVALVQGDWIDAMEREGTVDPEVVARLRAAQARPDGEPPCPACGTCAPLVDGACSDCGLQLEAPAEG